MNNDASRRLPLTGEQMEIERQPPSRNRRNLLIPSLICLAVIIALSIAIVALAISLATSGQQSSSTPTNQAFSWKADVCNARQCSLGYKTKPRLIF